MGGGGSHHVVYNPPVYRQVGPTDAEIQQRIRRQNQEKARVEAQARAAAQNLERMRQQQENQRLERIRIERQNFDRAEKLRFQQYLANLKNMNLTAYIPKIGKGERHYAVVGPISAGKTTLLNSIFNTCEQIGMGETTKIAKPIYKNEIKKLVVWDVPGINKDFSIYDPKNLGFFASCDKIFIIYKDSPKRCDNIIKVLNQIRPGVLYLIRTQCDLWDASHQKTLEQERQEDRKLLASWNIPIRKFYQHSSYVYGFDNAGVKAEISA